MLMNLNRPAAESKAVSGRTALNLILIATLTVAIFMAENAILAALGVGQ
jgi:hypothetical protein